jgi:hypothetical protein
MAIATNLKSMDLVMLARASEGLTHWRGIAVSFISFLVGGAFLLLGVYFAGTSPGVVGRVFLFLCWLLYAVIAGTGVSAVGIMLLDKARGAPPRSLPDALVFGLICLLKFWLVAMGLFLAAALVMLLAAIVYFVCKIPGVGPLLLFFAHPILVVCAGLLAFIASVFVALVMPALWDGDSVTQAIAKTIAILKERSIITVLNLLVMAFVTAIILGIIAAVILPGYFSMTALAAGVIGANLAGGISMLTNLPFALMYLQGGEGGHMLAVLLDTVVLVMLCISAALQVKLMGINLVYLGVSAGVDTAAAEHMLKRQLDQAKAKADEAKQRALVAAERAKQAAQQAKIPAPAAGTSCPSCHSATTPDDSFCENCGDKLK